MTASVLLHAPDAEVRLEAGFGRVDLLVAAAWFTGCVLGGQSVLVWLERRT